jgi:mRNA-degrading endonuclease toxin of MazEF toxin-antitoxin module
MSRAPTTPVRVHLPVPVDDYLARLAEESGEVSWMTFAEPVGRRAMLVVQNNVGVRHSADAIVAHVAATLRRDHPFLVALDAGEPGKPAWADCETMNAVPSHLLQERLSTLAPATMLKVDEAPKDLLGLGQWRRIGPVIPGRGARAAQPALARPSAGRRRRARCSGVRRARRPAPRRAWQPAQGAPPASHTRPAAGIHRE